jgi:hypothetical protein
MMILYNTENFTKKLKKNNILQIENDSEENSLYSYQFLYSYFTRRREECSIRTILERYGDLYIFEKFNKILVSKIKWSIFK